MGWDHPWRVGRGGGGVGGLAGSLACEGREDVMADLIAIGYPDEATAEAAADAGHLERAREFASQAARFGTAPRVLVRATRIQAVLEFREKFQTECAKANIDYVPMDTSISFDKALLEYLLKRQKRF